MANITEKLFINGEDRTRPAINSAVAGQNRLGTSATSTSATMVQSAVRFRTAVLQVAAAVGVYKAIGWSAELLRQADNIGKVADKVGLTTSELQELRFAAELVNVATTALDMGMQRFSRRLGEAAQGMGELKGIAEQYDIQLRDSNGQMRSNIDVLNDFADVIQNAESEQEQLRIAFKLFDSEGAAVVNMLKGGSAALTTMRTKAQELGIVVEEDLIRNASRAQDELKTLSAVIGAQLTIAVASLAPEIAAAATAMTEFVIEWAAGVKVINDFLTITREEEIHRLEGLLESFTAAVVREKRILEGEGGFFESLGLTRVHERGLRDAEAAVVRISQRLQGLREQSGGGLPGGGGGLPGGGGAPAEDVNAETEQAQADNRMARFLENEQALNDARAELAGAGGEQRFTEQEMELIALDNFYNAQIERLVNHGADVDEIEAARVQQQQALDDAETEQRLDTLQSRFQLMANLADVAGQLANGQSRTAFEAYKLFATGDALISTYRAVAGALSVTPWSPANLGFAALMLAQGLLQVRNIQSQQFGGGGGGSTSVSRSLPSKGGTGAPGGPGRAPTDFTVRLVMDVQPNDNFVTNITTQLSDDLADGRFNLETE